MIETRVERHHELFRSIVYLHESEQSWRGETVERNQIRNTCFNRIKFEIMAFDKQSELQKEASWWEWTEKEQSIVIYKQETCRN